MGALLALALVLPLPAVAATPSPDPPPVTVSPDPPATLPPPAPARQTPTATVSSPGPVVTRTVIEPVIVTRTVPAKPAAAKPKPAARPKPRQVAEADPVGRRIPHDRGPVPLARFVPAAEELNRGLVAVAGFVLAFVALAGSVVLVAVRRELA